MKPFRATGWAFAVALLAVGAKPAPAAWNSVFQVCCHNCGPRASVSASVPVTVAAPPCCDPCPPQQVCTTRYVQRCYYQPVTTYQARTYTEAVTTYRTSFYYEPVTSYRYSCYYDPCTCSYQQVACPVTSYRLRSQCCPVTSYLQRCCMVPVTSYRMAFYYEPVTTCCTTSCYPPCPDPCPPGPSVGEQRSSSAPPATQPGVGEYRDPGTSGSNKPFEPNRNGSSGEPPMSKVPSTSIRQPAPPPPPAVKLDRIVALPGHNVEGAVVRGDEAPRPGAKLLFVSADRKEAPQSVTADAGGKFRLTLASGAWLVYLNEGAEPTFQTRIEVREETKSLRLVSR